MIKLQDFAKMQNITDRQVQRLLKKYADELEGLYQRKGHNGTWLSDEACEILRGKMKQQPVIISEQSAEVERLKEENTNLLKALNVAKDAIIELKDKNIALEETKEKYEALKAADELTLQELEGTREELQVQKTQNARLNDLYVEQGENLANAQKEAKNASEGLLKAQKQFEDEKHLLEQQLEAEKNRKLTFKERLFGQKGK